MKITVTLNAIDVAEAVALIYDINPKADIRSQADIVRRIFIEGLTYIRTKSSKGRKLKSSTNALTYLNQHGFISTSKIKKRRNNV